MNTGTGAAPALSNEPIGFSRLKQLVESVGESKNYIFFLDKYDEVDVVSRPRQGESESGTDDIVNLLQEAQAHGPYFEILSIVNGKFTGYPVTEILGQPSDEELRDALTEAWGSRTQFYRQRVTEFGPSAYPRQSVVPLED